MENVEHYGPTGERPVQWMTGFKASLAIAAIFALVSRGIPWAGSGAISATVMGRELHDLSEINGRMDAMAFMLHFVSALAYAGIMMPIIHRFVGTRAWMMGAALGAALYLLNFALFAMFGMAPYREAAPLVTHLAFGLTFTNLYKGLVRRRVPLAA